MVRRGRPLPKALSQAQVQQLFAQIGALVCFFLSRLWFSLIDTYSVDADRYYAYGL
jgi:hypothetical protein